ncbi:type I restriction-modification system subunit M [Stutzerimonas stutzeri]|uniref:type I restriction-modification system subunit M n=1 Tax=Stutzerimonas stutzeri TaxID=316 RepID=UPI001EF3EFFD|nr:class I SAM-dependent DNA methyltransferase [Stutzerimonas stutzeri]CAB5518648.1 Probable type I restriction enzyme BthVORF4518P M protein [Stutzerimonas stutzeri]CAB5535122.1 Probable type I restriction enzyme BthVORF4518P M protein [Stutzerimonas stutzeri]CAC9086134.1 Probable type I restriction enzyme BthVORF4518P M protein [Stutzerimonas stutzeri]
MGIEVTSIEQKIERFISALETMGGSAGNQRLREALAWPETTYDSIKQQLLAEQRIVTGRGRGGSVAILESIEAMKARIINSLAVREVSAPYENKAVKEASPKNAAPGQRTGVVKKSDLYSSIWASCDELRGGMDASQYKDYVLFMLFIKYISDKYGNSDDFAPPVVIPPGASFQDMVALKGNPDIGNLINTQVIQKLIEANTKLARSDFPDFNDPNKLGEGPAMVERLGNLIAIFEKPELNFANNRADNDDLLGDAYEYLMRHFAQDSGKSKGQFYTPSEVSSVIAQVIGISQANTRGSTTAYDPTCGSGSLLLKVAAEAGRHITLEGQEKDVTTAGLARMNMILHGFPDATILSGDTLVNPKFKDGEQLRAYDYVVANPPFSDKRWGTGLNPANDPYQRFAWGEPPAKQGDYAYLLHVIRSMKATTGKGAVILPHGVLFRGNAEAHIRRQLVRSGMLKGIIGLPANLFYGTGIPACILVLDKENASARKGIFMLDASKGFIKDGPKNRLREQDIHRIVDTFRRGVDVPRYARMVPLDEIASERNDYNLNLPRYIDSSEPEDLQDIDAHLNGGIPERDLDAFAADWQEMPALRQALFEPLRPGYARLRQPMSEVRAIILAHPQFLHFQSKVATLFGKWQQAIMPLLSGIQPGDKPKALIAQVSETLLATFHAAPLLDPYDVYQHLMDYWAETMQDDAYLIAADGWVAQPRRIVEIDKKGKTKDKGWVCDLLPKPFIVARYFAAEQAVLEATQAKLESLVSQLAELEEEHGGEDGLLFEAQDEKGALTKASVSQRLNAAEEGGADVAEPDEIQLLRRWLELKDNETVLKRALKALDAKLDQQAYDHYAQLSEAEVKTLVVEEKWLAHLQAEVQQELQRISQTLTQRIRELAERYDTPLPQLEDEVATLSAKVEAHLKKMGAVWK